MSKFYARILKSLSPRPDNWSFLEKLLNVVDFWAPMKDGNSIKKLQDDFVTMISKQLFEKLKNDYMRNPNLTVWDSYSANANSVYFVPKFVLV